jgi:hypothetical protein
MIKVTKVTQALNELAQQLTVTDRQEAGIRSSVTELEQWLKSSQSPIPVTSLIIIGSYERNTLIPPLDDIDLLAVMHPTVRTQNNNPQSVMDKLRQYINTHHNYKSKVHNDKPCVTIELQKKRFEIIPCFKLADGVYEIPHANLRNWVRSDVVSLKKRVQEINRYQGGTFIPLIRLLKCWNRHQQYPVPSFLIEETAITLFHQRKILNYEEAICRWFAHAHNYLKKDPFKSEQAFTDAKNMIQKAHNKLNQPLPDSASHLPIWRELFGPGFPVK